jgi:hypothetical protein
VRWFGALPPPSLHRDVDDRPSSCSESVGGEDRFDEAGGDKKVQYVRDNRRPHPAEPVLLRFGRSPPVCATGNWRSALTLPPQVPPIPPPLPHLLPQPFPLPSTPAAVLSYSLPGRIYPPLSPERSSTMSTATVRRPLRSEPVAAAPADPLNLTPTQHTALHQVYQLILSFAAPADPTQRRRAVEEDREHSRAQCPLPSPAFSAELCVSAPLRQERIAQRRQGGRS